MKTKFAAIACATALIIAGTVSPASAHVSIVPGVSATGNITDALTIGKNNTINFRIGHGCSAESDIKNSQGKVVFKAPVAGATDTGRADTHVFSVTVPATALGDAGTTYPRPAYVPGWKTALKINADKTATVTWTAISRDFDVPFGPTDGANAVSEFGDFGLRVAFAKGTAGQTINFVAQQTCLVDIAAVKATKTKKAASAKTVKIYQTWDGTTDSDVTDNNHHETSPSVTVIG
jgi:hypothetical protein